MEVAAPRPEQPLSEIREDRWEANSEQLYPKYFSNLFETQKIRVLILGLNRVGKNIPVFYRLQGRGLITAIPTVGFNVDVVIPENFKLQVWDLRGQTGVRPFWRHHYSNTDAARPVVETVGTEIKLRYQIRVSCQIGGRGAEKNSFGAVCKEVGQDAIRDGKFTWGYLPEGIECG